MILGMKNLFIAFISLFFLGSLLGQREQPLVRTLDSKFTKSTKCLNPEYLLFSAKNKGDQKPSLLIYLHGGGGVGSDVTRLQGQAHALLEGIDKFKKGPCHVVVPQCSRTRKAGGRGTWEASDLDLLLKGLSASLEFDSKRIYLTGNSMGGYGSWTWGGNSPQHFAAIAPVVGGIGPGGPKDVTTELDQWAANLAKVPVYAFAGAKDKVVPAERSERMVNAIRKAGGKLAKIKVYQDQGHNARQVVYSSEEFYDWMFAKKRR
jgi:predicted peptidase